MATTAIEPTHKTEIEPKAACAASPECSKQAPNAAIEAPSFNVKAVLGFVFLLAGAGAFEGLMYILYSINNRLLGH